MGPLRFVTAASLFDGHDVSINIIRRLLQSKGAEVIHLGHNRSALEVVRACIQEDAHAVALSSYQGGHMEYFTYIRQLLDEQGAQNIKIFAGGGGVITPKEIALLHHKGITRVYSPADGMDLGLNGIVEDMMRKSSYNTLDGYLWSNQESNHLALAKAITYMTQHGTFPYLCRPTKNTPILGITGTGGAGKSSLIDELFLRFHRFFPDFRVALISIDPTKKKTNGALLGDRIRLGHVENDMFYIRSLATRDSHTELAPHIDKIAVFLKSQDFDLILIETSGIGQASDAITTLADKSLYVMTPEYGAATQLEKIEMLEVADMIAINKFEKPRSEDALRDVKKQYRRNHKLFDHSVSDDALPIYGTMAGRFNDPGVNGLFLEILNQIGIKHHIDLKNFHAVKFPQNKPQTIPQERSHYLRDIVQVCKKYNNLISSRVDLLERYEALIRTKEMLSNTVEIDEKINNLRGEIPASVFEEIDSFDKAVEQYQNGTYIYQVRGKEFQVPTKYESLAQQRISKVALPKFKSMSQKYQFIGQSNLPGFFPYCAGIFPFKRSDEDPKRMFAGEGGPLRTNRRFHFLSQNDQAKRLSTAFDSVTLYGEDPNERPDIFGKIGEAGVSIATLDDMQELFKGFDLTSPNTSVSMTINGPAPIVLAMFINTAIKQELGDRDYWNESKRIEVMRKVRGTVQADILKEDQAQNTCIFSLEFALKLMGDVQEYFCKNFIKNYYTVSISGYHIAEAGANPITQMAFTLANGFTFVEYFLGRGLHINDFCQNLSFFFSNGLDPEYTVMGSVARKIWAVTLRDKYGASEKSQMFKYHVQTSGRSLHAQEIDFNDIRTTLQAFVALSDNCNSLHTNAYDEAITTPTEESVRRAMAIQMIINKEFGMNKTDNPLQGSYLFEELCELVEEAVFKEFEKISDKGGVLGAMESMYQRNQIQEESLYYESLKDSGKLPIIGVNTYIADNIKEQMNKEINISRCTDEEKIDQINRLRLFKSRNQGDSLKALEKLERTVLEGKNIFEELLTTVNYCSLGEITDLLYKVGGRYRRNM